MGAVPRWRAQSAFQRCVLISKLGWNSCMLEMSPFHLYFQRFVPVAPEICFSYCLLPPDSAVVKDAVHGITELFGLEGTLKTV